MRQDEDEEDWDEDDENIVNTEGEQNIIIRRSTKKRFADLGDLSLCEKSLPDRECYDEEAPSQVGTDEVPVFFKALRIQKVNPNDLPTTRYTIKQKARKNYDHMRKIALFHDNKIKNVQKNQNQQLINLKDGQGMEITEQYLPKTSQGHDDMKHLEGVSQSNKENQNNAIDYLCSNTSQNASQKGLSMVANKSRATLRKKNLSNMNTFNIENKRRGMNGNALQNAGVSILPSHAR